MTTINISLPDQMKEFVDEEMGGGGYRDPSDYFNALLVDQLKRKAEEKLEALLQEGLATESSAVDKKDWDFIRGELESRGGRDRIINVQQVSCIGKAVTSHGTPNLVAR
jgi:antitoxin ParD1/3/4